MKKYIVERLELINYTRMSTSNIRHFVFMPDEMYTLQMVLGTNGSGKSSMQYEMWPLPPNADDFGEGGKKILIINYDGRRYELISTFEGKPRHEFIVDGQELNDGGKIEMFKALAEEHFGVTPEIRALALGHEKLETMSPARRRYWMVKMADSDFTYAIGCYNKLRDQHRDAQGAIKRLQKRLVEENNKMIDKTVVEQMTRETLDIKEIIAELYSKRDPNARKSIDVNADLVGVERIISDTCNEIERFNLDTLTTCGYASREEMEVRCEQHKREVYAAQQVSQHLFETHNNLRKSYDILIKAGTESLEELENRRLDIVEKIAFEKNYISFTKVAPKQQASIYLNALKSVIGDLYEKLSVFPSNDGFYSTKKAEECEAVVLDLIPQINSLRSRISRLSEDMEHKLNHLQQDSLTCPQCTHTWSTQSSEKDISNYEASIEEKKNVLLELEAKMAEAKEYLDEMSSYLTEYRAIMGLMRSVPILSPYFAELMQNGRLVQFPKTVAADLNMIQNDLTHHVEIERLEDLLVKTVEQIGLKKNLSADTLEGLEESMAQLEKQMGEKTRFITESQNKVSEITSLMARHQRVEKMNQNLMTGYLNCKGYMSEYVHSRYQEMIWQLIMNLQTNLARKEDALAQANNQQNIIIDIESQIVEAQMNERVAKAAHIALSPTNGAIAEGLTRSSNQFLGQMNRVINSIWTYPLEFMPHVVDEGQFELDYKFPFRKKREGKPCKDVTEGSESMKAVFNFAFKACSLRRMGLEHLPLFLDEFESAFDDTHRERAIYFVKKLIDEKAYGQIFMVSHYESNHGALTSLGQTCVLSRDNLMLPSNIEYNTHVTIN